MYKNLNKKIPGFPAILIIFLIIIISGIIYWQYAKSQKNQIEAPETNDLKEGCKNQCGNGTCEEIVCMAMGCPCSETKESCPQDCITENEGEFSDWKVYDSASVAKNSDEKYIIKYPNDWSYKEERTSSSDDLTTIFTDSTGQGMLIVVVNTEMKLDLSDYNQIKISNKIFYKPIDEKTYLYKLSSGVLVVFGGGQGLEKKMMEEMLKTYKPEEIMIK